MALLLREFSGNREPPGAGEGLDRTLGNGHSWVGLTGLAGQPAL